jgi:integrase
MGCVPQPTKHIGKRGHVRWSVRFRLDRKQCQESFDTKQAALAFCSDIETRDAHYALRVLHETEAQTTDDLDTIAAEFFEWKATRVRSDRTIADYRRDYRKWIQPEFGARRAGSIIEKDVQAWVDGMHSKLAPKSIGDRHALLHSIYDYACHPNRRLVDHNPCIGTDLPTRQKKPPKGLHPNEWRALHGALTTIDPDAADLALFLLASGWRISEAMALTAWDVEDYPNGMYVSMGHVLRRNAAGQHVVVQEGKGEASLRRIQLDPDAAAMVRRRLAKVTDGGLIFTTAAGGQWHYSNFLNRAWKPAVKAANLTRGPSPHWLRHTAVFWMALSGASLPELQSRIGHASITTTINVYGSMLQDVSPASLAGFAALRGAPNQLEG